MSTLLQLIAEALGPAVSAREIKVNGKALTVHAREPSGDEMEAVYDAVRDEDSKVPRERNRELRNRIIAATVCNADGTVAMTHVDAGNLPNSVRTQLQALALEINGMDAKEEEAGKNG